MITIVDYGLGNILAFINTYKRLNIPVTVAGNADGIANATKLILPGVGAFDHAMVRLEASGMRQALDERVQKRGVPILGVCVGMQMLADSSDEGRLPGLGWIPGRVCAFNSVPQTRALPSPHMGWNDVRPVHNQKLFTDLQKDAQFYFLHSYFFECIKEENTIAVTKYGIEFSCAIVAKNVYGVQFHPEKSHQYGATLLKNFAEL